jgi:hypothetical protein
MSPTAPRARRRGALLAEAALAAGLLLVALALTIQLLGNVLAQRRASALRQAAAQAAANAMEAIAALPRDERTPGRLAESALDPEAARHLPGGRLIATIDAAGPDAPASLRRVAVEVRWPGRAGRPESSVRLVAWLLGPGGAP